MRFLVMLVLWLASCAAFAQSGPGWRVVAKIANQRIVVVDERLRTDPSTYRSMESICAQTVGHCNISVWSDASRAPTRFPVSDYQSEALVALRNSAEGYWIWDCRVNKQAHCLAPVPPRR